MYYLIKPTKDDILHARSHKYIEKKMGKNGKWIYIYNKPKAGQSLRDKREAADANKPKRKIGDIGKLIGTSVVPLSVNLAVKAANNVANTDYSGEIANSVENMKNKSIKEKEARIAELEKELDSIGDGDTAIRVTSKSNSAPAEVSYVPKSEIESELRELRASLKEDKTRIAKHSAIDGTSYYISSTDQDIMHRSHKYVDRKMGKNGKWIYYYTNKPSLKARTGKYAGEKLHNQQFKSAIKISSMPNNSREDAEAKAAQRHIETKKIEKAQSDYMKTPLGAVEHIASKGMAYLEKLGLVSTRSKNITSKTKTVNVSNKMPSSKNLITNKTTKRRR